MSSENCVRKFKSHSVSAVIALAAVLAGASVSAFADPIVLLAPATSVKKVVNGKFAAGVDNGWVIYQGLQGQPTLSFYDSDSTGSFKLKTVGNGQMGNGMFFEAGGIVFAPCAPSSANKCMVDSDGGPSGVGLGFGQSSFGGAGGAAGGWVSDSSLTSHVTNTNQAPGSIAGLAADATNGAYAVGWDANSGTNHAILWKLDSAGKTYAPTVTTDLGTLGGSTSQALGISHNAKYVVGIAESAGGKDHAVMALTTATSWTDISGALGTVVKSRALAASDTGFIAGSATVKRNVGGKNRSVDIGFVYDSNTGTVKTFEAAGADVIPLKVLNDGRVVGNLEVLGTGSVKSNHPFLFNGTSLVDFGTMTLASTGQPAFGCRVNHANNVGEVAGSCIPDSSTAYGVGGKAFYIDTIGAATYVDVNAAIHANADAAVPAVKPYALGSVTGIDDQHEITVMGVKFISGTPNIAAFLVAKPAYNPIP